jgi:hypothetical protein
MARPKKKGLDRFMIDVEFDSNLEKLIKMHKLALTWIIRFWQAACKSLNGLVDLRGKLLDQFILICQITPEEHYEILHAALSLKICFEIEPGIYSSETIQQQINDAIQRRSKAAAKQVDNNFIKELLPPEIKSSEQADIKKTQSLSKKRTKPREVPERNVIPPSLEMVSQYCRERDNGIDAQAFIDHYETRNWIPKGYTRRMHDWQAAVRTWERSGQHSTPNRKESQKDLLLRLEKEGKIPRRPE